MSKAVLNQSEDNEKNLSADEIREKGLKRLRYLAGLLKISKDLIRTANAMMESDETYEAAISKLKPFVNEKIDKFNSLINEITENGMHNDEEVSEFISHAVVTFQLFDDVEPKVKDLIKEL